MHAITNDANSVLFGVFSCPIQIQPSFLFPFPQQRVSAWRQEIYCPGRRVVALSIQATVDWLLSQGGTDMTTLQKHEAVGSF